MHLSEILDTGDLMREIAEGFVRMRWHNDSPLAIFNYTEKAQYENHWTDVTRQTRGLIVDTETNTVLARPFDKFFNLGQHEPGIFAPEARVETTDKMDGSLGILYPGPDGWAIATRGSFHSEQAIHGTALLRDLYGDRSRYATAFEPEPGLTYLFEIVYPENRIVLDYGKQDALVMLGVRDIETGKSAGPRYFPKGGRPGWQGPRAHVFTGATTFERALTLADRPNAEGIVIRFLASDLRVKIKQEDYVRLHKLVTGLNERAVWEHLSTHHGRYEDLLAQVPDEFHGWVTSVADGMLDDFETLQGWITWRYSEILSGMINDDEIVEDQDPRENRKAFAYYARQTEHSAAMFQMLDGRDISDYIWKTLKPKGETASLMNRTEDNS